MTMEVRLCRLEVDAFARWRPLARLSVCLFPYERYFGLGSSVNIRSGRARFGRNMKLSRPPLCQRSSDGAVTTLQSSR
jgi:hypothetical protein